MSDSIANGYGCRPCKQVQLNVTDAILNFIGDGSALSHLNASNVDFGTLTTAVLPLSTVTPGLYGDFSNVSQVTIDQYGRVTNATNVAITSSQWTGLTGDPIYYVPNVSIGAPIQASANLQVTGNLYVSNAVTTMNVFATQYYGDGGLLSNISSSAITQPFANLVVSNSVTTTNVFVTNVHVTDTLDVLGSMTANAANATFFFDTFTIPYINTQYLNVASNIVLTGNLSAPLANITTLNVNYLTVNSAVVYGTSTLNVYGISNLSTVTIAGLAGRTSLNVTGNLYASNAVSTTNVFTTNVTATGIQTIAGLAGRTSLNVTGNIFASNAVTTTNVFVSNGLDVGPGTLGSNVVVFSNISGGSNVFVMDSNGRIGIGTTNPGAWMQSIYSNTTGDHLLLSTDSLIGPMIRFQNRDSGGTIKWSLIKGDQGSLQFFTATASQRQAVYLSDSTQVYYTSGVERMRLIDAGLGVGTSAPSATIHAVGNIFASNAVTTANLFTAGITSNVTSTVFNSDTLTIPFLYSTTLNVASTSNLVTVEMQGSLGATTLFVTGNVVISNAVTTTNVIATTVTTTNPIPFRNRLINGGMTLWQRNVAAISTTTSIYTTADRWCGALGTSGLILSQWPGPTENRQFPYSLQVTTSTTTTGVPLVEQRIENQNIPDFLNGTALTVSFWAGQPYGTLMPLTVGLYYATAVNNFGTQTLAVAAAQNTPTLTTANVYYSLSFTLTTALAATNGLSLRFTTGGASAVGSTVLLTGVQVEKGLVATPFEVRPYSTELSLAQRYYYQLTSPTAAVIGAAQVYSIFGTATGITTAAFWLPIQFPVTMRTPNYTFSNSAVTNFQLLPTGTTTITSVGIQSDSYTPIGATLNFVGTNLTAGSSYIFRTNGLTGSTVAFFGFSSEL